MPSPFPGMDPYLEKPSLWPDVHHELISAIRAALNRQLRPLYHVRIQERVYISHDTDPGRDVLIPDVSLAIRAKAASRTLGSGASSGLEIAEPLIVTTLLDEEIRENYLEVIDDFNRQVVTVIEVLSPSNKVPGASGRKSFDEKRSEILQSSSHWVEIDLLREGVSLALRKRIPPHDYFVLVSPVSRRPESLVWAIGLSQRLPVVSIPLLPEHEQAPLDLQEVIGTAYDHAGYDSEIDYTAEPTPPLDHKWTEWAHRLLQEKGLRPA
jgi:Protein of unknown function (DUF4058)